MDFKTLHRDVVQMVSGSNPYNWPIAPGETQAFITYLRFDNQAEATNYGKNLISSHLAKEVEIRIAQRFADGYELKVKGLSQTQLETLVNELDSKDWLNEIFEAQYQSHCDRSDLMSDYYDSAWA